MSTFAHIYVVAIATGESANRLRDCVYVFAVLTWECAVARLLAALAHCCHS